jgi:hypothetical protein
MMIRIVAKSQSKSSFLMDNSDYTTSLKPVSRKRKVREVISRRVPVHLPVLKQTKMTQSADTDDEISEEDDAVTSSVMPDQQEPEFETEILPDVEEVISDRAQDGKCRIQCK